MQPTQRKGLNQAVTSRCEHLGGKNPEHKRSGNQGKKYEANLCDASDVRSVGKIHL